MNINGIKYLPTLCSTTLFVMAAGVLAIGCDSMADDDGPATPTYVIQVVDQTFRIQIQDEAMREVADSLLANDGTMNVAGPLRSGDGGFNAPYSWHLAPDSIEFADATIEVCDGKPVDIEADLEYWLNTVGAYCPWGIRVVERN